MSYSPYLSIFQGQSYGRQTNFLTNKKKPWVVSDGAYITTKKNSISQPKKESYYMREVDVGYHLSKAIKEEIAENSETKLSLIPTVPTVPAAPVEKQNLETEGQILPIQYTVVKEKPPRVRVESNKRRNESKSKRKKIRKTIFD